ncbi:predicted protein [Histoplasma mississippiense (nom. inval.)]|uniref:predicted protein n=1 Tax=Ajellomyces capsulatus (strain NAm1 / WU24) TaxID=2059318 RepID=UPI000157B377|nr:predicted protein [Histoplasma mississippiense (nom. inval.)]EDN02959.1 predicted protein [Histoplasma mississippiense (nom. inval.)]
MGKATLSGYSRALYLDFTKPGSTFNNSGKYSNHVNILDNLGSLGSSARFPPMLFPPRSRANSERISQHINVIYHSSSLNQMATMFRPWIPKAARLPSPCIVKYPVPSSLTRRTFTSTPSHLNDDSTQQSTTTNAPSAHTSIYKNFGRAFAKVFLGGVLTYQIIYWAWMRLEVDEEKVMKNTGLESKARELSATLKKNAE